VRLLGDSWRTFGGATIPDDGVVELSEEEAAAFLRDRRSARTVEVVGWVGDEAQETEPQQHET
jgi:hypothetical protein